MGEVGIQEELDLKGIAHCGGPADADRKIELKPGFALPHDEDVSWHGFAMLACSWPLTFCTDAALPFARLTHGTKPPQAP